MTDSNLSAMWAFTFKVYFYKLKPLEKDKVYYDLKGIKQIRACSEHVAIQLGKCIADHDKRMGCGFDYDYVDCGEGVRVKTS